MSHRPQRKEKNCLNCGTTVQGKFCQVCGQENIEPKETFWSMVMHFFGDITHFDGKFFTSLKDLIIKPGFLSAEYVKGRRMSYLNPVRMYVFTSAIFFLIFFSINDPKDLAIQVDRPLSQNVLEKGERDSIIERVERKLRKNPADTSLQKQIALLKDTNRAVTALDLFALQDDFSAVGIWGDREYKNLNEYDSVQKSLPKSEKDGWLKKRWNKRAIELNEKYKGGNSQSINRNLSEAFLHKLPYLLFVSLPFFALILKLLYIRRRKEFYYADHGIFSIHHYILSFILILFAFFVDKMDDVTGWGIWEFLLIATVVAWPVYLFLAMKRFYKQNGIKTFFKFCLLNFIGLIVLIFLLLFFFVFAIFQV